MKAIIVLTLLTIFPSLAFSAMHKEEITYQHQNTELKGYLFWDDAFEGKRPGILVLHESWGLNDNSLLRAEMLAESGYVAFAADLFGAAKSTRDIKQAKQWVNSVTNNLSARVQLAFDQMIKNEGVETSKTAILGFGFGATSALQHAVSNNDVNGIIALHGALPSINVTDAKKIKSKMLILQGAVDPFISAQSNALFTQALSKTDAEWELIQYSGAQHSFSNPYSDSYGIDGMGYHESAERKAWSRTLHFLDNLFSE